jgi:anti-sigma regulatory factor (Ser/Thr protein kinase)
MNTLSAWLAACAPLKALEACSICSKIPMHCSRFEKGGDLVNDDIPPETGKLVSFLSPLPHWRGEILQCPECHQPYWYESEYEFLIGGSEDTWTYRRSPPEELFRDDWFIRFRFGGSEVDTAWPQPYFPYHSIAKLKQVGWTALHDEGASTPIASSSDLVKLGPVGLADAKVAVRYLFLVERVDNLPSSYAIKRFDRIAWKSKLTAEEKLQIEDLRAASRVEPETTEQLADRVLVKRWFVRDRRLVYRVITVFPDGRILERHGRAGRGLAQALGKQVTLEVAHTVARITPRVAEALDVALLHLVRNAVDHGVVERGTVRIRATVEDAALEITVEDDGPGIDVAAVREAARARGIEAGDRDADLVFEPGVSTRTRVTDVSGRGVGLDAVKTELARVAGRIRLEPVEVGTTICLSVPTVVRRHSVYQLEIPGAPVPLAISARWTQAHTDAAVIDPLRALGLGAAHHARALQLRWGYMEVALPTTAEPRLVTAERICPTPDEHACEVILIDGREALLVRPEHLEDALRERAAKSS